VNGLLVLDKPAGMTSRDVVNRVQRWFPRGTKIGHAGTLDPLATGVLVLCVGAATKLVERVQAMSKTYHTRILLGFRSDTDDADGTLTETASAEPPDEAEVRTRLTGFVGEVQQLPPAYSALKIDGRRAHELARAGRVVSLVARPVTIHAVTLTAYTWPFVDVVVDCGKGTYIRSIARDLGEQLGTGGLVQTLRRTRIGPFTEDRAIPVDTPAEAGRERLLPMTTVTNV
jgi:tRNA pseudouridine55 synthase